MLLAPGTSNLARSDAGFSSKYAALLDILLRVGDLAIVAAAGTSVYVFRFGFTGIGDPYRSGIVLAVVLALLIFPASNIYRSWRGESLTMEIIRVWVAWAAVLVALFALNWIMKTTGSYSRLWVAGWFGLGLALFAMHRWASRRMLGVVRAHGMDTRKVVLVGATHAGKKIVEVTRKSPWMGLEVVGYMETPHDQGLIDNLPCLGNLDELIARGDAMGCEQLWIALPMRAEEEIRRVAHAMYHTATTVRLVPDLFGYELLNQQATELGGVPVITLRGTRITGHARVVKAVEDRVLAVLILVLISPLMVLLTIGVKLSSKGPVLFKQKRHGLGGKEVEVWKFRSMRVHNESDGVVTQATRNDPRITRLGRFMRKASLDELPQFINVLRGDMSIVGPRPHAVEHDRYYQQLLQDYVQRNHVKPGVTGWAQVNGLRGETETVEKMAKRVEYDLAYVRNWSLLLDIRIIIKTVFVGFFARDAY